MHTLMYTFQRSEQYAAGTEERASTGLPSSDAL